MTMDLIEAGRGQLRCGWPGTSEDYVRYHDEEWGVPVTGDVAFFERLTFEAFQSGLSWVTIMRRRPGFRRAFAGFDPDQVAEFGEADIVRLMSDTGIIRNQAKIRATITNAKALRALRGTDGDGAFERLIWSHRPTDRELQIEGFVRPPQRLADLPASCKASVSLAKALKARGFVFVGPTTLYAGMQANGLVDDHLEGCFRRGVAVIEA